MSVAMGQPAAAGVAVGVIFIVLIGSFVGYRLYRHIQWRRLRKRQEALDLAAAGEQATTLRGDGVQSPGPVHFPMRSTSPGPSMVGSLYGDALPRHSYGGSISKTSFRTSTPTPYYAVNGVGGEYGSYNSRPRRANSATGMLQGIPVPAANGDGSQEPSMPGSPNSQGDAGAFPTSNDVYDGPTHARALSSASSTMTLRRMYAAGNSGSAYRGLGGSSGGSGLVGNGAGAFGSGLPPGAAPPRRDSYLPHLPENRDAVQIVPPQPLGFSFGMAQAVDQRTLAFSKTSGIGDFDEVFTGDLAWSRRDPDAPPMTDAETTAALQAHLNRGGTVAEEDRLRYLAQGPSRTLSPVQRGAIHNHIYNASQPGSSGVRTPDGSSSRPRSPVHPHLWEGSGSSSDIGPSVSQRGGPSHPLETSSSVHSNNNGGTPPRIHTSATSALALNSEHSPLTMMSGDDEGVNNDAQADISFNTLADSPILKAFQTPAQAHASRHATATAANLSDIGGGVRRPLHTPNDSVNSTHVGATTPGLMSADDGQSRSSSRTGPPSLATHQQPPILPSPVTTGEESKRTSRGWFSGWRNSTSGPSPA